VRSHGRWWAVGCAALGALAIGLVLFDASNVVRAPVVLTFLLVCPGLAIVRFLGIDDLATECALAVALSLALDGAVSLIQAYTELWSPTGGLLVIAGITMVAVAVELLVRRRAEVGEAR
jgi:hypothetical protein